MVRINSVIRLSKALPLRSISLAQNVRLPGNNNSLWRESMTANKGIGSSLLSFGRRSFSMTIQQVEHNNYPEGMTEATRELAKNLILSDDVSEMQSDDEKTRKAKLIKRRLALSRAITLIESKNPSHNQQAALLLTYLLKQPSKRPDGYFRVGIAGPPGAGKSTLVEALGNYIMDLGLPSDEDKNGEKVDEIWKPGHIGVVCIDPSSIATGGSILGDKTRMQELSRDYRAFVRPAATQGVWGGLAPRTDDVIRIIAASETYPLILLETVGLGQSELEVKECVDMIVLAVPPGGGDSLQGVKKGIVEIADTIVVTKADGDLVRTAKRTAQDYRGAMQFLNIVTEDEGCHHESTPILLASSFTGDGLDKLWEQVSKFRKRVIESGAMKAKRKIQDRYWMWKNLRKLVKQQMNDDPYLSKLADEVKQDLDAGRIPPRVAASQLLQGLAQKGGASSA